MNGNLVFRPASKTSVSLNSSFKNSLLGDVPQILLSTGQVVNTIDLGSFRNLLLGATAHYQVLSNLDVQGIVNHERQSFMGRTYEATQFGGSANYNLQHRLLGSLSFSLGAFDTANQEGNSALGFAANLNFARKILRLGSGRQCQLLAECADHDPAVHDFFGRRKSRKYPAAGGQPIFLDGRLRRFP